MTEVLRQASLAPVIPGFTAQAIPKTIPQTLLTRDASGTLGNFQPGGPTTTSGNSFFTPLDSPNGRSCFTCHQPQTSWTITPVSAAAVFALSGGKDPLFAAFDGMNCPDLNPKTLLQRTLASSQLLRRGNIRIALPIPAGAEWAGVKVLRDPTRCANNATFGLPSGAVNTYRRPLSSNNLTVNGQLAFAAGFATIFQGAIMWDGREPSLESQFVGATMGHAQAPRPTDEQVAQGVAFEVGLFTAQYADRAAGILTANGATGGPVALAERAATLGPNTCGDIVFPTSLVGCGFDGTTPGMDLFDAWETTPANAAAASIARGQDLFNNRTFTVRGVAGFNDFIPGGENGIPATCTTCHNNRDVGGDFVNVGLPVQTPAGTIFPEGRHLGIGDNSGKLDRSGNQAEATALSASADMPLYEFWCPVGSIPFYSNPQTREGATYDVFETSDPGVGLITGKCADLGKFKVPRLRGLTARAPFFHGGNARSVKELVQFYDVRFSMGLTDEEEQDLVNFLNAL
jgi:cytochrome c peroxidase